MESSALTVRELAAQIGTDPKVVRAWMRRQGWRHPAEYGSPWALSEDQADDVRTHFASRAEADAGADPRPTFDLFGTMTVGGLLDMYAGILAELRHRGLIRTHNAPIGDLAEYCAAMVYDGLLASNSEKSHDLVAEDGRRIQVKVRVMHADTSPSAVFSSIRSYDFDACVFLLISGEQGDVVAAREWTAQEVRASSKHREYTNSGVVRVGQVMSATAPGVDRLTEFREAWADLTSQIR